VRSVHVYITAAQLKELASGRNQMAGTQEEVTDVVIESADGVGGLFIHQPEHFDEEGSGVWMDADGTEYPDASQWFVTSLAATNFEEAVSDRT
jgi:hypothetical protein